ncbi:ROK family protein [Embleya sp. AB8]|uniref:ROK family protein n=1 Tax=Embleya sp. AB8 TaxID=3156304 RepID=UPI003C750CF3
MTAPSRGSEPFDPERAGADRRPVVVFDLGGTWWRVGVYTGAAEVRVLRRDAAISRRTRPGPVPRLQRALVDFVVEHAMSAARRYEADTVGISLGAALNGRTGRVLASAPLWGPRIAPWDLRAELAERAPELRWFVLNDVSALAYAILLREFPTARVRRAAALTVSTGIACRTIDLRDGHIPLDPEHGLQGEIGHLPAHCELDGRTIHAECDCGARDHVASFASGPGIESLLRTLPETRGLRTRAAALDTDPRELFRTAVRRGSTSAQTLLDAITRPLAHVLLAQATLDPEVGTTFVSGGVAEAFGEQYRASLLRNLRALGLYGISTVDDTYFDRRLAIVAGDGLDALRGVGFHVRGVAAAGRRAGAAPR